MSDTFLAEGEGFEPSIRFPVYTLSKRAPSAARPPLHEINFLLFIHLKEHSLKQILDMKIETCEISNKNLASTFQI